MLTQKAEGLTFASGRQAKAFATLTLIQERGANSIGDYARTAHLAANVTRAYSERLKNLNEKFGKVFLPFLTKVIIKLTNLVDWFSELSPTTKKVILVVGGLVAVLGPLALILGTLVTMAPAIGMGFAIMFGPIGLAVAAISALLIGLSKLPQQEGPPMLAGQRRRQMRAAAKENPAFSGSESSVGAGGQNVNGEIGIKVSSSEGLSAATTTSGFGDSRVRLKRGRNLAAGAT